DPSKPSKQILARCRLAGGDHGHDGVEAFGNAVAPARGEVFVETAVEYRQQASGGNDDRDDPRISEQVTRARESFNHRPEAGLGAALIVNHDAQPATGPGLG